MFKRRLRDSATGRTTYIAPGTVITGRIAGRGTYVFCGEVQGDCDIQGLATLAEQGRWLGTLCADDIIVAGRVEGDVIARGRVEVGKTAHITGSLSGHSIAVASGAVIEGQIRMSGDGTPTSFEEKRAPVEPPV